MLKRTRIGLLLATLMMAAANASAASALAPYTAHYQVITHRVHAGDAKFQLEQLGPDRYRFSSSTHTIGLVSLFRHDVIKESSIFSVDKNAVVHPLQYRYSHSGDGIQSEAIDFDWTHGIAHSEYRGKKKDVPVPTDATDPFLAQLKLSLQTAAGMTAGKFPVVHHNKLETYHLQVKGKEAITVPAGRVDTIRVERHDPGSTRTTIFWLAPKLHYAPVKVEQLKEGDSVFRLELEKISFAAQS